MKSKRIVALEARRDVLTAELTKLDEAVIERGSDLTADEQATYDAHSTELDTTTADLAKLIKREADVAASVALGASLGPATNRNSGVLSNGGQDEQVYRADGAHSFAVDIYRSKFASDRAASERIARHLDIVRASATSSDLAGLIVPQYVTTDIVGLAREGRPFLNALASRPVRGASVILPRVVTAPTTGAQDGENTAFSTAALDTEEVTISTKTIGGYTDLSVQSLEWDGAVDQSWLFSELLSDLYTRMDYLALHGTGANGQPEGLFNSDGTNVVDADTASAFAEFYGVVTEAASMIRKNDKRNATHLIMSSARWFGLMSAMDSEGRPLMGFQGSAPQNVGGTSVSGPNFAGLPVIIDDNCVRAGEDDSFAAVIAAPSIYFAESQPKQLVCDCVVAHTGTVRFVLRSYMAFNAEIRPYSTTIIQDLPVPEFPTLAIS